ncbi:MAG: hypothetical protein MJZ66_04300 [Bacteroidales bacterium]|nr:hypothetical protein [Bacteroidales bacterium]
MTDQEHIEKIIQETFKALNNNNSHLLITSELNEQHLRFNFVERLIEEIKSGWDVKYSVETPTNGKYKFSNNGANVPVQREIGQKGSFDLTIHDNNLSQIIALIEFKAKNPDGHEFAKDFCKLGNSKEGDNNTLRLFIHILNKIDDTTIESLKYKYEGKQKHSSKKADDYIGYDKSNDKKINVVYGFFEDSRKNTGRKANSTYPQMVVQEIDNNSSFKLH